MAKIVSNVFDLSPEWQRHVDLCELEASKRYLVSDSVSKPSRKQKPNKTNYGGKKTKIITITWVQPSLLCYRLMKTYVVLFHYSKLNTSLQIKLMSVIFLKMLQS